jgi:5'-3' exonuclease
MNDTLLIDANSWGYAAQSGARLRSGTLETQAAFGFIRTLRAQCRKYPSFKPTVLWDGRADWRYKLYPEYKGNRDSDPEKLRNKQAYALMRPYIARMLRHLGVTQLTASTHEADDLAGYFVAKLSTTPGSRIILSTGDTDWMQLVRQNVAWDDPREESRYVDSDNFYAATGCLTPFAFLETKILAGDSSDTISGVGGLGAKLAPEFIAEFGSVRKFWQLCDAGTFVPRLKAHKSLYAGTSPFTRDEWALQFDQGELSDEDAVKALKKHLAAWPGQGREIYRRNFQLMQLLRVTPPKRSDLEADPGNFDVAAFGRVCEELGFASILANLHEFTHRFKRSST